MTSSLLISTKNELHNCFDIVNTRSSMQLSELKSKPHGSQSLREIIDGTIGAWFYPQPGSNHNTLLLLNTFNWHTHLQVSSCNNTGNYFCVMCFNPIARLKCITCSTEKMQGDIYHITITTYTRLDSTRKYRAFLHLFHMTPCISMDEK